MRSYSYRVWFGPQCEIVNAGSRADALILAQANRIRDAKHYAWDNVEWRPPSYVSGERDGDWQEIK